MPSKHEVAGSNPAGRATLRPDPKRCGVTTVAAAAHLWEAAPNHEGRAMFRLMRLHPPNGWNAVGWELAIVVLGVNKFNSRRDVVIYAVTTAVGTIPVSLLLVLTVTMAAGTKKMLQRNVMVRNLSSLEALGGVTGTSS